MIVFGYSDELDEDAQEERDLKLLVSRANNFKFLSATAKVATCSQNTSIIVDIFTWCII